jgi:hypothetical protein
MQLDLACVKNGFFRGLSRSSSPSDAGRDPVRVARVAFVHVVDEPAEIATAGGHTDVDGFGHASSNGKR